MDEIIVPAMDSTPPPSTSQASSGVLHCTSKLTDFTVAAFGGGGGGTPPIQYRSLWMMACRHA